MVRCSRACIACCCTHLSSISCCRSSYCSRQASSSRSRCCCCSCCCAPFAPLSLRKEEAAAKHYGTIYLIGSPYDRSCALSHRSRRAKKRSECKMRATQRAIGRGRSWRAERGCGARPDEAARTQHKRTTRTHPPKALTRSGTVVVSVGE